MSDSAATDAAAPHALPHASPAAIHYQPWLHAYAMLLVLCVFLLIGIGGTVTSTGAGMAVPDWPTTFDHHMITAPPSVWWHQSDRFWEHFHRLMGTLVGMLTIGMAVWLTLAQRSRPWLPTLGWALLMMVIAQGLMGGFRVTEASIGLAIVHGIFGQIVLASCVLIAAATSRPWLRAVTRPRAYGPQQAEPGKVFGLRYLAAFLLVTLVIQLALGAWMRHNGAGLAVPDFPTAYGQLLPPLHADGLAAAQTQWEAEHSQSLVRTFTPAQVSVHLAHRAWAIVVCTVALTLVVWVNLVAPGHPLTRWPSRALVLLLAAQVVLGVYVIWSGRHVDVATAHQACGALVLAAATLLTIRLNLLKYTGVTQTPGHNVESQPRRPAAHVGQPGNTPQPQPAALSANG